MLRLAIAQVSQESGTFLPSHSTLQHFRDGLLLHGAEVLERLDGRLEVGGAIAAGRQHGGLEWVPLLAAWALPWGALEHADYLTLKADLLERLDAAGPLDGMLLVLHGALATTKLGDPDGDLLAACRAHLGDKPLVASLDLHANVTHRMLDSADALVAYHTAPHVDIFETGVRAANVLIAAASGQTRPHMAARKLPMITPAETHDTSAGPMADLMGAVLDAESEPGILSVSLCPVQPWIDVPELGWTVVAVADGDAAQAQAVADRLAALAWHRRHDFLVDKTPMPDAVRAAASGTGLWVVSDSGDNTGGGAPGDSTLLLKALLSYAPNLHALLSITDAESVARAVQAGVGKIATLDVGAKLDTVHSQPVRVTGLVRTISEGLVTISGPTWKGAVFNLGRTVVLEVGAITIVLSEHALYNIDPSIFRALGLEPTSYRLVQTKSPCGFRAAYTPLAEHVVLLESPGYTTSDFAALPWRNIPRSLFPLDESASYQPESPH